MGGYYMLSKIKSGNQKHSIITAIVVSVFAVILIINFFLVVGNITDKKSDIDLLQAEIAAQQAEIDELNNLINNGSELEYIERIARENYGFVAPGERAFYDSSAGN